MSRDEEARNIPLTSMQRAKAKLIDQQPTQRKHFTDLLFKYMSKSITFAKLTGVSPKDTHTLAEAGRVKFIHGRLDEAKQIFESLVQVDHLNPIFHTALGCVYQKQKRWVDSVYEFTMALKHDPQDIAALVNRGEVYLFHKNYRKAATDFRAAILLDPRGRNRFSNRARSLVVAIKRRLESEKQASIPKENLSGRMPKQLKITKKN